jgi:hypothetical protein
VWGHTVRSPVSSTSVKLDEFLQGVRGAALGISVVAFLQLVVLDEEPGLFLGASYLFAFAIPLLALAHGLHYVRTALELETRPLHWYLTLSNIFGFTAFLAAPGSLTWAFGPMTFWAFTAFNLVSIWIFGSFLYKARTQGRAERRAAKRAL